MIRYNAAHPGAERDIFPHLAKRNPNVVAYTATRWRRLLSAPRGWTGPVMTAGDCYRFCLSSAHVDVVLTIRVQEGAVAIPARAVQQSQDGTIVFVIREDMTVESRQATIERMNGATAVIAQGVNPGDRVVVEGQLRLTNGAKVDIVSTEDIQR